MKKNKKLQKLKQQVIVTSEKQKKTQEQKIQLHQELLDEEKHQGQLDKEITELVRYVFEQSEIANAQDRELLQEKLDKFSFNQQLMNEQLIKLNNSLTDLSALENLYKAKRKELESNYQAQERALKSQIQTLKTDKRKLTYEINAKRKKIEEQSKLSDNAKQY